MPQKTEQSLSPKQIAALAIESLDDLKAEDVRCLDVRHLTTMMDYMIIASGRSDRHVRAMADTLAERCKEAHVPIIGTEGQDAAEWVLVDLASVVVHLMRPKIREFYELEKLWDISRPRADADHSHIGVQ